MLTKTSLLATRALLCLAKQDQGVAVSPRSIALELGESAAYLTKVLRFLVKAGILRAEHGSRGGVRLNRRPQEITLRGIVEACQGTITAGYCQEVDDLKTTCAFHRAAVDLQHAIVTVLERWTLEHLVTSPGPTKRLPHDMRCMLATTPVPPGGAKTSTVTHVGRAVNK